jgi:hypothetical protein
VTAAAVTEIAAAVAAGHRDAEFALTPSLIDGVELRDGIIVGTVLQIAGLYLVDSFRFVCG